MACQLETASGRFGPPGQPARNAFSGKQAFDHSRARGRLANRLLKQITEPLDASQWNKRMSLLTHRYLIEYGLDREDDIVEKAFRTLELFCVGMEAKQSLEVR